jgi:hypothetical protein
MLVRTGFVVVLVLVNVPGFRPILARGWHDQLGRLAAHPAEHALARPRSSDCGGQEDSGIVAVDLVVPARPAAATALS